MNRQGKKSGSRLRSFVHAFQGVFLVFVTQKNFQIQVFFGVIAILSGMFLSISIIEWSLIILAISLVLSLEAVNTSMEMLSNKVENNYSETIKKVKDIAAAAVLISSIGAAIIGCLIFIPKIINQFSLA